MCSILAIIVLYRCRLTDSVAYQSLLNNNNSFAKEILLFVYDNSPATFKTVNQSQLDNKHIIYFHSPINNGVSAAYNEGFKLAEKLHKQWLLLLDQDSILPDNYLDSFLKANQGFLLYAPKLINKTDGNTISPCKFIMGRATPFKFLKSGTNKLKHTNFLNSGLIISVDLFKQVGGFSNKLPMYYSDFNFINRCRSYISNYYLLDTFIVHDMSSNDVSDFDAFMRRFDLYIIGALNCYDSIFMKLVMFVWVFLRAIKLFFLLYSFRPLLHLFKFVLKK